MSVHPDAVVTLLIDLFLSSESMVQALSQAQDERIPSASFLIQC